MVAAVTAGLVLVVVLSGCGNGGADGDGADDRPVTVTEITATATAGRSTASTSTGPRTAEASRAGSSPRPEASTGGGSSATSGTGSAAALAGQGAALGGRPYCGASQDVEEIVVEQWSSGAFRVSLRPTVASRKAPRTATTQVLWSAIGACVPGVGTAASAESLHQQLACHQALAQIRSGDGYATGDTYDLESWRPPMTPNSFPTWISTRCGNTLGTDPAGGPTRVYRPDGVAARYPVRGEHG
ncbi:DUF2599 domain-containing protein [Candidatus Frankia nodulisporulans]|uniref:DUF2599 domain-containing protein n=1 Tax=Candidatus Frankia nodulisporulans TaxID=2060052 RepID=UPI001CDBC474|nr:DUF2599 domain-containing protein [Candidatus Frankia nodulisporulans]